MNNILSQRLRNIKEQQPAVGLGFGIQGNRPSTQPQRKIHYFGSSDNGVADPFSSFGPRSTKYDEKSHLHFPHLYESHVT